MDIGTSPLLGGSLITITEGIIEFGQISLCLYSSARSNNDIKKVDPILRLALDIDGVIGASYSVGNNLIVSFGRNAAHSHINNGRIIDSPSRLMELAPSSLIRETLKIKSEIQLSAFKKLRIVEFTNYLVLHANLDRRSHFFSHKKKRLSKGIEGLWSKAIESFISSKPNTSIVLIGSDSRHFRKFDSNRIYNAHLEGLNLSEQLSLVEKSSGFVGMSAGPSVVALLGSTPYYVFKDASHHKTLMDQELGEKKGYDFSTSKQFYIREYPSAKNLLDSITSISNGGNPWHT